MPNTITGVLKDVAPLNHQPPLCLFSGEGPSYQDDPGWVHPQQDNWQAGINAYSNPLAPMQAWHAQLLRLLSRTPMAPVSS